MSRKKERKIGGEVNKSIVLGWCWVGSGEKKRDRENRGKKNVLMGTIEMTGSRVY